MKKPSNLNPPEGIIKPTPPPAPPQALGNNQKKKLAAIEHNKRLEEAEQKKLGRTNENKEVSLTVGGRRSGKTRSRSTMLLLASILSDGLR